jgi:hypothetical protein
MHRPQASDKLPSANSKAGPLSRFEGHCLCRRMRECEELLQLAVLGVEQVQSRHCPDRDLAAIAGHLADAERHVEAARRLAARWSE